jgi:CheY-like chemotaxis protein
VFLPRERSQPVSDDQPMDGGETILLVEDEHDERRLMEAILQRYGYRVHAVGSSAAALELAETMPAAPDLLLTDVMLAGLKGPELAHQLRTRFPDLRTLYITGYSDDAVLRLGIREDAALLVQKPFTAAMLARTVRSALGARAAH